ncbi:hypothetical protein AV530_000555 [Patagioenas fasciata monilis]|uniref:Uncharacterized protein n=1 Tax=Patagioenas fasciata monilis TaxID=372326 RepID=A0A1V4IGK9_PATFA|nr:hypothetical protein AV530_000555 [Patagioenas fasciata monilis]
MARLGYQLTGEHPAITPPGPSPGKGGKEEKTGMLSASSCAVVLLDINDHEQRVQCRLQRPKRKGMYWRS